MKPLAAFISRFGGSINLNAEIVTKSQRYYVLPPSLRKIVKSDFYYAGLYLGKVKNGAFYPSFNLLNMLVSVRSNKVFLGGKAAWLFICGRDVFRESIVKAVGSQCKDDYTLIMNEHWECLGFGIVKANIKDAVGRVVIKNMLDLGDFLRREG